MNCRRIFAFGVLSGLLFLGVHTELVAAERIVELRVLGCGCPDYEQQVALSASEIDGVNKADANVMKSTATITFDDTKTNLDTIKNMLLRDGYVVVGQPQWIK